MDKTFFYCDATKSGWLKDCEQSPVLFDLNGDDVFSIVLDLANGTWTSGKIDVQYSNAITGPWVDFETALHFDSASSTVGLVGHVGRYVRLNVHTALNSGSTCNVIFHSRRSDISSGVTV